jgi:phosphoglucosamine mutase
MSNEEIMISSKLFGTDGIRARFDSPLLSPESITRLGEVLGNLLRVKSFSNEEYPQDVVIGRDTRDSGPDLEAALIAGLSSQGINCHLVGIMPTAAVATLTRHQRAGMGIMISASHNPYYDNGFKIFDGEGFKIPEAIERRIEQHFFHYRPKDYSVTPRPGQVNRINDAKEIYIAQLISSFPSMPDLCGLKLVVDSACGAASVFAKEVFSKFGCDVIPIGEHGPKTRINDGFGSEAPQTLKKAVLAAQAHVGVAFDGDADRMIVVNENGHMLDGDALLALMAIELKRQGRLLKNILTATIMSSIALDKAVAPYGIEVVRTAVGDKLVAEKMREEGFSFGGENSGHIILFPWATTGDGILSALSFLAILKKSGTTASNLMSFFQPTPKVLRNIAIDQKIPLTDLPKTLNAIEAVNKDLKSFGRVFLRYSGTENKARLLVEAPTNMDCERIADHIGNAFCAEITEYGANRATGGHEVAR